MILSMESSSPPPSSSWYPSPQAARSLDLGRSGAVVGAGEEAEVAHNQQRQKKHRQLETSLFGFVCVCHKGTMSSEIAYTSDQRLSPPKVPTSSPKPVQVLRGRGRAWEAVPGPPCQIVPCCANLAKHPVVPCRFDLQTTRIFQPIFFSFVSLCRHLPAKVNLCDVGRVAVLNTCAKVVL